MSDYIIQGSMSNATRPYNRKRKDVDDYAAENPVDFMSYSTVCNGQQERILVCRFCCQPVKTRSDRIREHLSSKRHQRLKLQAHQNNMEQMGVLDFNQSALKPAASTFGFFPGNGLGSNRLAVENQQRGLMKDFEVELLSSSNTTVNQVNQVSSEMRQRIMPVVNQVNGDPKNIDEEVFGSSVCQDLGRPASQQTFRLRWGMFENHIVAMFTRLREKQLFLDVTLWCEGKAIQCHKIVLSACSKYFEEQLINDPSQHTTIFLKDMRFWEIEALVEFMYSGEIVIQEGKLKDFLRAAESIKVESLKYSPTN